jgi:hypothetical protein
MASRIGQISRRETGSARSAGLRVRRRDNANFPQDKKCRRDHADMQGAKDGDMNLPYSMPTIAFGLLALIAAGGVLMLAIAASGNKIPKPLGVMHGLGGVVGVGLVWAGLGVEKGLLPGAVLTAAMFGGILFFKAIFRDSRPLIFVVGHGALAGVGLYLLYQAV